MTSSPALHLLRVFALLAPLLAPLVGSSQSPSPAPVASASSSLPNAPAHLALDGNRFSSSNAWSGLPNAPTWFWQVEFPAPRPIGAILQIHGNHDFVLRNAPKSYRWEFSRDGQSWSHSAPLTQTNETRCFRLHRLPSPIVARFARIHIAAALGDRPALREIEFYDSTNSAVAFPEWIVAVNVTHDSKLPGHGQEFIPLARTASPNLQAQQIWLADFNPDFLRTEPRPLCAFLSGSFKDWCEVDRNHWRGIQQVLQTRALPLWASCGGAQGLALVSEYGVDRPWDCPHCRDPRAPKTPLYTHIGHLPGAKPSCGNYDQCVFERGPFTIQQIGKDPAFARLPESFTVMESHCGQIAWAPRGWELIATAGPSGLTKTQCLRLTGFPIYAAQFHIEMSGTPDVSRQIMDNFLGLARVWR